MHTNLKLVVADDANRLADDLDGDTLARDTYLAITNDKPLMASLRHSPYGYRWYRMRKADTTQASRTLTALFEQMAQLKVCGATPATVAHIEAAVTAFRIRLFTGADRPRLDPLDLEECGAENAENLAYAVRKQPGGETPENLRAHAQAIRDEVRVEMVRAEALEARAREMDRARDAEQAKLRRFLPVGAA